MELPNMEIDRKELKRRAREAMRLVRPPFWVVTLVYVLMTNGASILLSLVLNYLIPPAGAEAATVFFNILLNLYLMVAAFGFHLWSLWTYRRMSPDLSALIQGFSVTWRVIGMNILILLMALLYSMVLGTGIVLVFSSVWVSAAVMRLTPLLMFPFLGILMAALYVLMLRYALAPFLLADRPEDGPLAAVRRSTALMRGYKWELFKLELSFLGWQAVNWVLSWGVPGYFLYLGGLLEMLQAADWGSAMMLAYFISNSLLVYGLTTLVTLPVTLWLSPYRGVALAGFYHERMALLQKNAPPLT